MRRKRISISLSKNELSVEEEGQKREKSLRSWVSLDSKDEVEEEIGGKKPLLEWRISFCEARETTPLRQEELRKKKGFSEKNRPGKKKRPARLQLRRINPKRDPRSVSKKPAPQEECYLWQKQRGGGGGGGSERSKDDIITKTNGQKRKITRGA